MPKKGKPSKASPAKTKVTKEKNENFMYKVVAKRGPSK